MHSQTLDEEVVVASSAPLRPPRDWFSTPEADGPTPLTFTDEGQVYGHLALWETCHRGFVNGEYTDCVKAPRSASGYSQFYGGGAIQTAEGETIPVGRLTYDTGHAPITAGSRAAAAHYDNTGKVGAFVQARDGQYGIWLSGAVRSDLSPEGVRDMRANPPSGDWRRFPSGLDLIASLAVPCPGFPVTRSQLALAASANGELEVTALILTGYQEMDMEEMEPRSKEFLRRRRSLVASLTAATFTAEERRRLAKSGEAMPDGSFPIRNCSDAANAIHAIGRADNPNAVRRHIRSRVRALNCSGSVFDNWK